MTLYFTSGSGSSKLDGVEITPGAEGKCTFNGVAGTTYSLTKKKTNTNLVLIVFSKGGMSGIDGIAVGGVDTDAPMYDLMGRRVVSPVEGQIVIVNGRKLIYRK